jgi:cell division protein FtsL
MEERDSRILILKNSTYQKLMDIAKAKGLSPQEVILLVCCDSL